MVRHHGAESLAQIELMTDGKLVARLPVINRSAAWPRLVPQVIACRYVVGTRWRLAGLTKLQTVSVKECRTLDGI